MLTEHEEKLIQRYYIYPKIAITAVIMALALGVPFILLEMIDDLVFHDEEVIFWGLYVYLGFAALYLILFCYCTLRAKLGMRKEEWQELQRRLRVRQQQSDYSAAAAGAMAMGAAGRLMQKSQNKTVRGAGTAAQVAGAVGAVATAGAMSAEIAHNAQATGQRGVDVGVGVDEGGHDDAALGVDDVGVSVLGPQRGLLAHLYDLRALKGHRTVLIIALPVCIAGNEPSVCYQIHLQAPPLS